jgi:hypothetical protein
MQKTTIYLRSSQKRAFVVAAKASGRTVAELIREGVDTARATPVVLDPQVRGSHFR